MTPEFDRRSAIVLDSPYWALSSDHSGRRWEEKRGLQTAIQKSDTYDDLSAAHKKLYDMAEAEALAANKAYEEFAAGDVDGYGRIHEVWP